MSPHRAPKGLDHFDLFGAHFGPHMAPKAPQMLPKGPPLNSPTGNLCILWAHVGPHIAPKDPLEFVESYED